MSTFLQLIQLVLLAFILVDVAAQAVYEIQVRVGVRTAILRENPNFLLLVVLHHGGGHA